MIRDPRLRELPAALTPVAEQALLNLALTGRLTDEYNSAVIKQADRINRTYDQWMEVWGHA